MPYDTVADVPDYVPADKKKQWLEVWNSAYKKALKDGKSKKDAEQSAFAQANGVVKKEDKSLRECRFIHNAEIRAKSGDKPGLEGYAAVFNQRSEVLGFFVPFRETIMPGAFSRALQENQDVRALINHDSNLVLGRTKSGTLALTEDDKGLRFSLDLPSTQAARDLLELVQRGDIDQCSFAFRALKDAWTDEPDADGNWAREIHDADLFDVSIVTYPAYPQTSVGERELWPDGVPAEIRMRGGKRQEDEEEDGKCECDCPQCTAGNCADCTDPDCDDPDCDHADRSLRERMRLRLELEAKCL